MGSGVFLDSAIKASSVTTNHEAKQARPNVVPGKVYSIYQFWM